MTAINFLTKISIIFLIGIIITYFSKKFRIPNILGLILSGILLSFIKIGGEKFFVFSSEFLTITSIIALIMIVFDSASRLPLRDVSNEIAISFELTIIFIILEMIILSASSHYIAGVPWFLSILLSSVLIGTDPTAVLSALKGLNRKAGKVLKVESIINTVLTVTIPFIVIDFSQSIEITEILTKSYLQLAPFLQEIVTGIGSGIIIGLILFKILKNEYMKELTPLSYIGSSLLTYVLAEGLNGNGVLAVATLGIFFGYVKVNKKRKLKTFGNLMSNLFEILVFVLLGVFMSLPSNLMFYLEGLILFTIYISLRIIVVFLVFNKSRIKEKEKLFIGLNTSKGVAVGVVAFSLLSLNINASGIVDIILLFIIYSVLLSTITIKFAKFFFGKEIKS